MSIFLIVMTASNTRLAATVSGSVTTFVSMIGLIYQDNLPRRQQRALFWPPLPTIAFQLRSVTAWSAVAT